MIDLGPWYEARQFMVDALVADLAGTSADQTVDEKPTSRFGVGILHPRDAGTLETTEVADDTDQDAGTEVDAEFDPGVSFSHMRKPSTMGLTVGVSQATTALAVVVSADRYLPVEGVESAVWSREAVGPVEVAVSLAVEAVGAAEVAPGLELRYVVREPVDGVRSVTLVLVNANVVEAAGAVDSLCWFRPSLEVTCIDGDMRDRRPAHAAAHMDDDERSSALLHRAHRHLAVGHGVAVEWEEGEEVRTVRTTFFPQHDLPLADASRSDVPALDMGAIAAGDTAPLRVLVDAYETWIQARRAEDLPGLSDDHVATAQRHLDGAVAAAGRMRVGIGLLEADPLAQRAFRAMNHVMRQQRVNQERARATGDFDESSVRAEWRPFQMAFILMNLEGMVDPEAGDRGLADVLWFPTGGGKTEAYLGLIGFVLVHRRLRGAGDDGKGGGVAVLMRYTLRLLTLQQFERAAGLVAALEVWRRNQADMAQVEPFSVGLWVGQAATPNSLKDAKKALRLRGQGIDVGELGDPVQLLRCPWCASKLDHTSYEVLRSPEEMRIFCPAEGCEFSSGTGLPVHVVDDEVYRVRPSLVIGTVDKFAMLAWKGEAGALFGNGTDAPPELIVQDELHLISGPLGTLVGLYETAVDALSEDPETGARPKVVASTATIRRAKDQVKAVFAREVRQFPPPGIDASDSFFAVNASPASKGTRKYVGVMAPSISHATLTLRTYAALLQAGKNLEAPDEVRDAYWTLLGYFNSLRVLGGAYIQTIDDVRDRIKVVAGRTGGEPRSTREPRELTSRKKSTEIPLELEALQQPYPSPSSPDTVLATNMISVGVDVDRLGLMVVSGQPQTTAEYIQATSRVGRRHPGLVVTLFNAGRSRDLSHYESFTTYHRSIQQNVEPTGATPFAARAMDRGLHGVLTILARHKLAGASTDASARVPIDLPGDPLGDILEVILERAREVSEDAASDVEDALEALVDQWAKAVDRGEVTKYAGWRAAAGALLVPAGTTLWDENNDPLVETFPPERPAWATLTSLRNVDRESSLRLVPTSRARAKRSGDD